MKDQFVTTKNVRLFEAGVKEVTGESIGGEHMLLVIGAPGLGKTNAGIHHSARNGAVMIRTLELMKGPWLLRKIVQKLGAEPERRISDIFDQIIELQTEKKRTLIFDEIDRFTRKTDILETIRDIHDVCQCPIVLIGEESADKKLAPNRRFYRRLVDVVKFEKFDRLGVTEVVEKLSTVKFDAKAIDRTTDESKGMISGVLKIIKDAETWATTNGQTSVGVKDLWKD